MTGIEEGEEETTYEWDLFDHLAKAEGPGGSASYAYDALERLSERNAGETVQVVHYGDLTDRPTYDANGEGKTTTSYVTGSGGLLEERSAEATSYPLADAHGDITAITGPTGSVESRQSYDPWGAQLSGPSQEMGYLGAYERPADQTTGLIQMGARSYSPELGAFVSEDPVLGHVGIGISFNRYPYAWDNPLNLYDLDGREVCISALITVTVCPKDVKRGAETIRDTATTINDGRVSAERYIENAEKSAQNWLKDRSRDFEKTAEDAAQCLNEALINGRAISPCHDQFESAREGLEWLAEHLEEPPESTPPFGPPPSPGRDPHPRR